MTIDQKGQLMPEFKFQIGDTVMFKNANTYAGIRKMGGEIGRTVPSAFTVLERVTSECHGGIQLMYVVRGSNIAERIPNICEFELDTFVAATDTINPMEFLAAARDEYIADQNWAAAKIVKDARDAIRALGKSDTSTAEPTRAEGK